MALHIRKNDEATSFGQRPGRLMRNSVAALLVLLYLGGCQASRQDYRTAFRPEIVNNTDKTIDVIAVNRPRRRDGRRELTFERLVPGASTAVHVGLDDRYLRYSLEELFITEGGACEKLMTPLVRSDNNLNGLIVLEQEVLSDFLASCAKDVYFSSITVLSSVQSMPLSDRETCLMLDAEGNLTPMRDNELPWHDPASRLGEKTLRYCANPKVNRAVSVF